MRPGCREQPSEQAHRRQPNRASTIWSRFRKNQPPDRRPTGGCKGGRALASHSIIASQRGSRHATEQALFDRLALHCAISWNSAPAIEFAWTAALEDRTGWSFTHRRRPRPGAAVQALIHPCGRTGLTSAGRHWLLAPPKPQHRPKAKPFGYDDKANSIRMQSIFYEPAGQDCRQTIEYADNERRLHIA